MGLNPSNGIAQRMNPLAHVFDNLARNIDVVDPEINAQVRSELSQAGIQIVDIAICGEVPTTFAGELHGWKFKRAWYYYVAKSDNGIPLNKAEEFHRDWGTQVRVSGHCGCPSPKEYCHNPVDLYHIDTQEGLNAFAKLLDSIEKSEEKH